jgi:hypothetical protein
MDGKSFDCRFPTADFPKLRRCADVIHQVLRIVSERLAR